MSLTKVEGFSETHDMELFKITEIFQVDVVPWDTL